MTNPFHTETQAADCVGDDIPKALGESIRVQRRKKGLTSLQLAVAVGVSPQQMWKYECGVHQMSVSTLFRIAGALNVDVAHLLPIGSGGAEVRALTAEARGWIQLYCALPELDRQSLSDLAQRLSHRTLN